MPPDSVVQEEGASFLPIHSGKCLGGFSFYTCHSGACLKSSGGLVPNSTSELRVLFPLSFPGGSESYCSNRKREKRLQVEMEDLKAMDVGEGGNSGHFLEQYWSTMKYMGTTCGKHCEREKLICEAS